MSSGEKSLLDVGGLTQPANILIEKISDAIGVLYEPRKIIKLAQAQAYAELIRFNSKLQLSELELRAVQSHIHREALKQDNIEHITANAIGSLSLNSSPDEISKDWLSYFFNHCDSVSEPEMQRVWGEVLARKASDTSSFSKKTISTLAVLESSDAETFTSFCSFAVVRDETPELFIFDVDESYYRDRDVNYGSALHLESMGLVHYSSAGFAVSVDAQRNQDTPDNCHSIPMRYFGKRLEMIVPFSESENLTEDIFQISTGQVNLTAVGQELFALCRASPADSFISYWRKKLKFQKIEIVEFM